MHYGKFAGDYGYLGALRALHTLRLSKNRIETFLKTGSCLDMDALEVLHLAHNRISDIGDLQLHRCPHLKELELKNNHMCNMSSFDCMGLLRLDISKNRVRQLAPHSLVGLSLLRELRMEEAGLRALNYLSPLKALSRLYLAFNRISDIAELERLIGVGCIIEITMCNNPIARRQLYRPTIICHVPSVCCIDGRNVDEEERERAELLLKTEQPLKFFLQEIQPNATNRLSAAVTNSSVSDSNVNLRRMSQRGGHSGSKRLGLRG